MKPAGNGNYLRWGDDVGTTAVDTAVVVIFVVVVIVVGGRCGSSGGSGGGGVAPARPGNAEGEVVGLGGGAEEDDFVEMRARSR